MLIILKGCWCILKIYEDDSSKESWEFYKSQYSCSDWDFWEEFDFLNVKTRYEKGGKYKSNRYLLWLKDDSELLREELGEYFSFGGEKVFNFGKQSYHLKKIIDNSCSNNKDYVLSLLEECKTMHSSIQNLAILPTTGGLNNVKGGLYFDEQGKIEYSTEKEYGKQLDRLDTFIAVLDDYFNKKSELILGYTKGKPNEQSLKNFLNKFTDVYDFVNKIYKLNDKEFINELICDGRKPIENVNDVKRYCRLAKEYWKLKNKVLVM